MSNIIIAATQRSIQIIQFNDNKSDLNDLNIKKNSRREKLRRIKDEK